MVEDRVYHYRWPYGTVDRFLPYSEEWAVVDVLMEDNPWGHHS